MVLLYPTAHLSGGDILSSSLPLLAKGYEGTKKGGQTHEGLPLSSFSC